MYPLSRLVKPPKIEAVLQNAVYPITPITTAHLNKPFARERMSRKGERVKAKVSDHATKPLPLIACVTSTMFGILAPAVMMKAAHKGHFVSPEGLAVGLITAPTVAAGAGLSNTLFSMGFFDNCGIWFLPALSKHSICTGERGAFTSNEQAKCSGFVSRNLFQRIRKVSGFTPVLSPKSFAVVSFRIAPIFRFAFRFGSKV